MHKTKKNSFSCNRTDFQRLQYWLSKR